jgi:hypothetical protein
MAAQITNDELRQAIIRPILLERAPLAGETTSIPIIIKYQQDDYARILRSWISGEGHPEGEDHFLKTFAVPHFCRQAGLTPADYADPSLSNPPVPADFAVLTDAKRALLRRDPYRLVQLSVEKDRAIRGYRCIPQRSDPANRISRVIYCERDAGTGLPDRVPQAVLDAFIQSSLRTNSLIPSEDRRLIIFDLYLNRPRFPGDTHYWHSDSGTLLGVGHDPANASHGHESLDYASLLMITDPGAVTKSTAFTSNKTTATEETGEMVPGPAGPRRAKNMIQFLAKNGTCTVFCDWAVKHTTSTVHTLRNGSRDASSNLAGELVVQRTTPLGSALTDAQVALIEAPSNRMFLRTHFVKWAQRRYPYEDSGPVFVVLVNDIGIPNIAADAETKKVTINRFRDLNETLGRTGQGQLVQATTKSPYGLGVGGKKTKRNKLRGGNPYENIMIECKVEDYYFFDKTKTGLTVVMD